MDSKYRGTNDRRIPSVATTRLGLLLGVPIAVVFGLNALAWAISLPKTWTPNETLKSADLNSNFAAIASSVVDLTSDQTVGGTKTFSMPVNVTGALTVTGHIRTAQDANANRTMEFWSVGSLTGTACTTSCGNGYCGGAYVDLSTTKAACTDVTPNRNCICYGQP